MQTIDSATACITGLSKAPSDRPQNCYSNRLLVKYPAKIMLLQLGVDLKFRDL